MVEPVVEDKVENLVRSTCALLSARDLKAVCRFRGFRADGKGKEALESFLAPRFLEPAGVAAALASLEEPWLIVLHRLAMEEAPRSLGELQPLIERGKRSYRTDYRALFRRLSDGLLNRGVVLIEDRRGYYASRYESRFERLTFSLPESHRELLPPFPAETQPFAAPPAAGESLAGFCRSALRAALPGEGGRAAPPEGLLGEVASAISFENGVITLDGRPLHDLKAFARRVRRKWTTPGSSPKERLSPRLAAEHILNHLPAGRGITAAALSSALESLQLSLSEEEAERFCEDGCRIGLAVAGGGGNSRSYATARDAASQDGGELGFSADEEGIDADLEHSGMDALLELAALSKAQVRRGRLRLSPDLVLLGRAAARLASLASVARVRASSDAFRAAIEQVEERHGKVLLHEGLLLLRVEDLGLRTLLSHRFGSDIRALEGPYLAAPRRLGAELEKVVRKEGYSPRRVS
jgi:hypothetical protein